MVGSTFWHFSFKRHVKVIYMTRIPVDPRSLLASPSVQDTFSKEEIRSLEKMKELMGISCIDDRGNVFQTFHLKAKSDGDSAYAVKTFAEIGNKCGDHSQVWWHTHVDGLSSMSMEDRLSAGNLKMVLENNLTCAIGLDGYSCHDVSKSPPDVFTVKWKNNFIGKLKDSKVIDLILDTNEKWGLDKGKESDISQVGCYTNDDGVVICTGIDWKTGFNKFPIGAYNEVYFNGAVDVEQSDGGFLLSATPHDGRFECVTIKLGGKKRVLYCE